MTGTVAIMSRGGPASGGGVYWAGGPERTFRRADVLALGKQHLYGSFVRRVVLRLRDQSMVFVRLSDQTGEDEAWLRVLMAHELAERKRRRVVGVVETYPSRDCAEVIFWIDVADVPIDGPKGDEA